MTNYAIKRKKKKYRSKIKDIFPRNEIPLGKRDKYVLFYIQNALRFTFLYPSDYPEDDESKSKHVAKVTDKLSHQ
jgi:hypothetical protein